MSWWHRNIVEPGKLPLLLLALSFVVTFLLTRLITRLIRAGRGPFKNNVTSSGLHIHHSVPGIILLIVGAALAVSTGTSPWREVAGVLVGVGASLVLDEFALILHLDDVYWSEQGQASVQAVALTAMSLFAALVGFSPFGVNDVGDSEADARWAALVFTMLVIAAVVVCAMKGKYRLGLLAVFVPIVAVVGAIRLARPDSRWAKRRYPAAKLAKASAREQRFNGRWDPMWRWLGDLVAGSPTSVAPPAAHGPG